MAGIIQTHQAPASRYYSQAVAAGGLLFVSGTTGVDPQTWKLAGPTIEDQTIRALQNCEAILGAAGATLDDVVEVQVLLARYRDFDAMNDCYASFFPAAGPARSVAKLGVRVPGVLVSMRMVAACPAQRDRSSARAAP